MGPTGLVESAKACGEAGHPVPTQKFINLKLAAKVLANLCQVKLKDVAMQGKLWSCTGGYLVAAKPFAGWPPCKFRGFSPCQ